MANFNRGFGRVIRMNEANARKLVNEKMSEREEHVMKLKEKYSKTDGLAFQNGKLDEMFEKDARKASNLLLFLENTEKKAWDTPILFDNATHVENLKKMSESRMAEAMQTGGAMALMLPTDIVKIARIGYTNQVAQDIFDVWGMSSMKDSLYKLESTIGSAERGDAEGEVIYETYNDGRYPTTIEEERIHEGSGTSWSITVTNHPIIPFKVAIIRDDVQIAVDNGAGILVGEALSGTNTVNYTTGEIVLNLAESYSGDALLVRYTYDFEDVALFPKTGSVLLNLVEYPFSATLKPLAIEWTRFTQDLMESKLGLNAKDMLIAGAGDEFRKASDERAISMGIRASNWHDGITFDTDFAQAGADSSFAHAQSVINAVINAENLTYDKLGRLADTTNIVCDSTSYSYLTKHQKFTPVTPTSRVGIFKVGDLAGRGVYMAPKDILHIDPKTEKNTGKLYLFGKSAQGQNVDAPVSIGTFGTGITTNPVELKNFNSQMGLGVYSDAKVNNKFFATKVILKNLTANS